MLFWKIRGSSRNGGLHDETSFINFPDLCFCAGAASHGGPGGGAGQRGPVPSPPGTQLWGLRFYRDREGPALRLCLPCLPGADPHWRAPGPGGHHHREPGWGGGPAWSHWRGVGWAVRWRSLAAWHRPPWSSAGDVSDAGRAGRGWYTCAPGGWNRPFYRDGRHAGHRLFLCG